MPTKIPYLDEIWNPITGCSSKGCKVRYNCWARSMVKRFKQIHGAIPTGLGTDCDDFKAIDFNQVQFHPDRLEKPLHWRKPRRIGVCFTGDFFDGQVPWEWRIRTIAMIRHCPQHQFFFLTKHPENMIAEMFDRIIFDNLWYGISITDQDDADRMIPEILKIPGKHWISIEPMLSAINLDSTCPGKLIENGWCWRSDFDWVVIGAESGSHRRPCKIEWIESIVKQCKTAKVPVFVKQIQDEKGRVIHDIKQFPKSIQVQEFSL